MKRALIALLLSTLLAFAAPARAQKPQPQSDFRETLSKATLAVYGGKQTCQYVQVQTFFGSMATWQCAFESHFVCTATAVRTDGRGDYIGLTAGHCFSYKAMDRGFKYYVSEGVNEHPVLREIKLIKFENNDQYDYALFTFTSMRDYPVVEVDTSKDSIPALGSRIINANFSYGLTKEITEGVVVSGKIGDKEAVDAEHLRGRYLVQMPFGPGSSGSAIVNEDTHKIVGLVEAMIPATQMAAIILPTGDNFLQFIEDDSVGLKPEAEPKTGPQNPQPGDDDTVLHQIIVRIEKHFNKR